jgi:hypothetical protein
VGPRTTGSASPATASVPAIWGKILSGLALGIQDEATTLPISDGDRKDFPPEPLFTLGERVVSRAIIRRDDRLDAGRLPGG